MKNFSCFHLPRNNCLLTKKLSIIFKNIHRNVRIIISTGTKTSECFPTRHIGTARKLRMEKLVEWLFEADLSNDSNTHPRASFIYSRLARKQRAILGAKFLEWETKTRWKSARNRGKDSLVSCFFPPTTSLTSFPFSRENLGENGSYDGVEKEGKRERNRKKKVVFEKYKSRTMQLPRGAAFLRGAQFFEILVDKSPTGDPLSRLSIKTFPPNLSTLSFYFFSLHHLERERWNPFESPCLSETDLDSSSPRISSSPRLK